MNVTTSKLTIEDILVASHLLREVIVKTPLQYNAVLSDKYQCNVFLKREDLQVVRSFKLRGAYYLMRTLSDEQMKRGVVCASAGNHAQGVAYSCKALGARGTIFMPSTTPRQKVSQVKLFGGDQVEIVLVGDTFDDSFSEAIKYGKEHDMTFIHPFDHEKIIAGQGTVGMEILNDMTEALDYLFVGIGGGGLAAGVGTCVKGISPLTDVIGVEPQGAASMKQSFRENQVIALQEIDTFVDGAAVKQVGQLSYELCKEVLDDIVTVPEGKVCSTILDLYNQNAIVAEPAGALTIAALDEYKHKIKGKNVVCIVSGGNNDIDRMQDIKERSLIYEGLKHYFIINFPQRAGALREFLDEVLGPTDDITRFEYTKKNNKDNGTALVGIELKQKDDYEALMERMKQKNFPFMEINHHPTLFNLLI
ncbi:threonine ammonia-lyase IlvA [Brevibacillus laterosporus]|uniref:threonine ammonia-lyase IlvA n=1 Tax=Brevibacillus laterosporus TaxID=1465 RepID=UPI0003B22538|nr:threonine ammonia-lyase IlvA [Brevibacillus laterosporus]ERM16715.1 threonine dehydratase [Brevibacillus laterosporus PE36]